MQNLGILDNTYTIIRQIAQDLNGITYLVRNQNTNSEYTALISNNNLLFQNEVQMTTLASGLNHPNIVHFIQSGIGNITNGNNIQNNQHYLITDYYSKGSLLAYLMRGKFQEKLAKFIFLKILKGVEALHGAEICHRDLKLDNIYLDQNFKIKIVNFSLATNVQVNNFLNDFVGTRKYSSPQIENHQAYNGFKNDIFSLGVILFCLVKGSFGFSKATQQDHLYINIINNQINNYWESLPENIKNIPVSDSFKLLFIKMVSLNENDRPTINEILADDWLNEIVNLNEQQLNQLEDEVKNEFLNREQQMQNNP